MKSLIFVVFIAFFLSAYADMDFVCETIQGTQKCVDTFNKIDARLSRCKINTENTSCLKPSSIINPTYLVCTVHGTSCLNPSSLSSDQDCKKETHEAIIKTQTETSGVGLFKKEVVVSTVIACVPREGICEELREMPYCGPNSRAKAVNDKNSCKKWICVKSNTSVEETTL